MILDCSTYLHAFFQFCAKKSHPYLPLCISTEMEMIVILVWHECQFFGAGTAFSFDSFLQERLSEIFC